MRPSDQCAGPRRTSSTRSSSPSTSGVDAVSAGAGDLAAAVTAGRPAPINIAAVLIRCTIPVGLAGSSRRLLASGGRLRVAAWLPRREFAMAGIVEERGAPDETPTHAAVVDGRALTCVAGGSVTPKPRRAVILIGGRRRRPRAARPGSGRLFLASDDGSPRSPRGVRAVGSMPAVAPPGDPGLRAREPRPGARAGPRIAPHALVRRADVFLCTAWRARRCSRRAREDVAILSLWRRHAGRVRAARERAGPRDPPPADGRHPAGARVGRARAVRVRSPAAHQTRVTRFRF